MHPIRPAALGAVMLFAAAPTYARDTLTLERALALARERAPRVRVARAAVEESRARLVGAQPLFRDNPTLSGALGRRADGLAGTTSVLEGRLELTQALQIGGQRRARIAGAEAAIAERVAVADEVLREVVAEVALAFFRALHARERMNLAVAAEETAGRSAQALERRFRAGDVPVLDLNLAKTSRARAVAAVRNAVASFRNEEGHLRRLLDLDPEADLEVSGDLRDHRRYEIGALLERAPRRADVRVLLAAAREADAEVALGRATSWPGVSVGAAYERDEGADVFLGTLSLELPFWAAGQELRAAGSARAKRIAIAAETTQRGALSEVRTALAVHQERLAALRALEETLPLVRDNEDLARKSYEAGQLGLGEWLIVRREALEARFAHLDQLLVAAEAGLAVATAAGVTP